MKFKLKYLALLLVAVSTNSSMAEEAVGASGGGGGGNGPAEFIFEYSNQIRAWFLTHRHPDIDITEDELRDRVKPLKDSLNTKNRLLRFPQVKQIDDCLDADGPVKACTRRGDLSVDVAGDTWDQSDKNTKCIVTAQELFLPKIQKDRYEKAKIVCDDLFPSIPAPKVSEGPKNFYCQASCVAFNERVFFLSDRKAEVSLASEGDSLVEAFQALSSQCTLSKFSVDWSMGTTRVYLGNAAYPSQTTPEQICVDRAKREKQRAEEAKREEEVRKNTIKYWDHPKFASIAYPGYYYVNSAEYVTGLAEAYRSCEIARRELIQRKTSANEMKVVDRVRPCEWTGSGQHLSLFGSSEYLRKAEMTFEYPVYEQ